MNIDLKAIYPQKIVCLTEESVETLYLLGREELIAGVSAFVKRPAEAQSLPKVSFFTSSNYKKILDIRPDLVIGHSDIQKDIARDLIEKGLNVFIANHRSVAEIIQYIQLLSQMVDAKEEGQKLIRQIETKIKLAKEFAKNLQYRPKVYFEEWDDPVISAIKWVSEIIEICGGINIHGDKSSGVLAKDRFVSHEDVIRKNPDIIFGCWCGKKVKIEAIKKRNGYSQISAVKNNLVFELAPEIFLQPGPAPLLAGLDILIGHFKNFSEGVSK